LFFFPRYFMVQVTVLYLTHETCLRQVCFLINWLIFVYIFNLVSHSKTGLFRYSDPYCMKLLEYPIKKDFFSIQFLSNLTSSTTGMSLWLAFYNKIIMSKVSQSPNFMATSLSNSHMHQYLSIKKLLLCMDRRIHNLVIINYC
jgi:hypothetical protein